AQRAASEGPRWTRAVEDQSAPIPKERKSMLGRMGWAAWSSSCSRNAHDKNVLVRRAHSRINQATLEKKVRDWEDTRSGENQKALAWANGTSREIECEAIGG